MPHGQSWERFYWENVVGWKAGLPLSIEEDQIRRNAYSLPSVKVLLIRVWPIQGEHLLHILPPRIRWIGLYQAGHVHSYSQPVPGWQRKVRHLCLGRGIELGR